METKWSSNTPSSDVHLTDFFIWFFHLVIEVIQFILFYVIKQYREISQIHDTIVCIWFYYNELET